MQATYHTRTMRRDELSFALELAAQEGWNPGLYDAEAFYAADPDGFIVGLLNDQPVGCISAVRYDSRFGFIGLYIMKPEHRAKGYGRGLWKAALSRLNGCTIGLDGVPAQQENYQKSGFSLAHKNIRYELMSVSNDAVPPSAYIVPLSNVCATHIDEYDEYCFAAPRSAFLSAWCTQPDTLALAWYQQQRLGGFAALRRCPVGWKVGPLFADGPEIAQALLNALCRQVKPYEPVYIDVPETNPSAMQMVAQLNGQEVFTTARMYAGAPPAMALDRVYGITSFELG